MESKEIEEIDKRAHKLVEEAHASLRENSVVANFILEIRKDILLGTKFQLTNINYKDHQITLTIIE